MPPKATIALPPSGRQRPVIAGIRPRVDGAWPPKVAVGDWVPIEADVVINGHDMVSADVAYAHQGDQSWSTLGMHEVGNDRWRAELAITEVGSYRFVVRARPDTFETWRRDLQARLDADQDVSPDLLIGAALLWDAAARATGPDRRTLAKTAELMRAADLEAPTPTRNGRTGDTRGRAKGTTVRNLVFSENLGHLVARYPDPTTVVASEIQTLFADPERARFSAWYELFPRSASPDPKRPGTLADVEHLLPYVSRLGFDVLYLPPIHPIGRTNRKGRDGRRVAEAGEPGSPWAIGAAEGGHTTIHPELGNLEDFDSLVA
ncbi:MAG: maltotransferase domain-containing protein, partial [Acidimicrobiales bacterium]